MVSAIRATPLVSTPGVAARLTAVPACSAFSIDVAKGKHTAHGNWSAAPAFSRACCYLVCPDGHERGLGHLNLLAEENRTDTSPKVWQGTISPMEALLARHTVLAYISVTMIERLRHRR